MPKGEAAFNFQARGKSAGPALVTREKKDMEAIISQDDGTIYASPVLAVRQRGWQTEVLAFDSELFVPGILF